jgi:predicted dienelactone hydrolase
MLPAALTTTPVLSADKIYLTYGLLERSISVDSLEKYAREGTIDDDLAVYARYAAPGQLEQVRKALLARIDLTPVAVSQFFYTPQGEILLERIGQVIQTESRQPGFYAIRAALTLAAAQPEGLTPLNVLRQFPTNSIRIDLGRSLQIAGELEKFVNQTGNASQIINQEALAEAASQPATVLSQLPDLRRRGALKWQKVTIELNDSSRDRTFSTDVYLPQQAVPHQVPVIVISHGLGSDRTSFEYLAQQLASYDFVVAALDHPGSNTEQLKALLNGTTNDAIEPIELINRPLDVKFLLNELERRSQVDATFQGRLNLQQVGVVGQSFGGYTALSLAGAEINFPQLREDCGSLSNTLNLSLLLQCRALLLPNPPYELTDPRIKAAIAVNPVSSSIFGQPGMSRIQVPTMIVASSADTVAPALPEQIQPFTWLTTPEKYLALIQNGTHFSTIQEAPGSAIPVPPQAIGPSPALARRYLNVLSVAFFKTYVANQPQYRPYLSASYAQAISQPPLGLSLVQSLTATQLTQALNNSAPRAIPISSPELVPPPALQSSPTSFKESKE